MLDCYPTPAGGLQPWVEWESFTTAGIPQGQSDERVIGFFSRGGLPLRTPEVLSEGTDYYLLTYSATDFVPRLYRMDGTADETSWSLLHSFPAGENNFPGHCAFQPYVMLDGTVHVYLMLSYADDPGTGVYRIRYSDGDVSKIFDASLLHAIAVHQNRLFIGTEARLRWVDPGTETFAGANVLDVEHHEVLKDISFIHAFSPSDLLVAKDGASFVLVQDDIEDPIVRVMARVNLPVETQSAVAVDEGIAYQVLWGGVYKTGDGSRADPLSKQVGHLPTSRISRQTSLGHLAYYAPWLITPGGYILDTRSNSWFQTSFFGETVPGTQTSHHMALDWHVDQGYQFIATTVSNQIRIYRARLREMDMPRVRTYHFQSAPLRHPTGRQIEMGRVEVYLNAHQAGATCRLRCGSFDRTLTNIPAGRQQIAFDFRERSEVIDLKLDPDSGQSGVPAPTLEVIRMGSLSGHLTPHFPSV